MLVTYPPSNSPLVSDPVTTGPGNHAKHGPSSLRSKEICPGYQSRFSTNPAAELGTRIHAALETDDFTGLHNDFEKMLAERCIEARAKVMDHFNFYPKETHREIRLTMDLEDGCSTFGTADEVMISGSTAMAVDWKTGRGAVDDAAINAQAQAYTLGIFQRFPEVEKVYFTFIIPQRDEISFAEYTREDIPTITLRLSTIIRRAEHIHSLWDSNEGVPPELLNPQTSTCCYCDNQARCSALSKFALNLADKYTSDFEIPDIVHGSEIDDPEVISKLLPLVPIMESWASGVRIRAKEMVLRDGVEIPNHTLKERSGAKLVTSPRAAWDLLKDSMSIEDYLDMMGNVSFNSLADIVYNAAPKGQKSKAKNEFEDQLRDMGAIIDSPKQQYFAQNKS